MLQPTVFSARVSLCPPCLSILLLNYVDALPSGSQQQQQQRKLSKVEELMQKDLEEKRRRAAATAQAPTSNGTGAVNAGGGVGGGSSKGRLDHWLMEGIVVKVLSPALKSQGYYKEKVRLYHWVYPGDQACASLVEVWQLPVDSECVVYISAIDQP